jgi:carbonic anhydrase/acetyltransferase-like protein (isoleucine patch superfamily)
MNALDDRGLRPEELFDLDGFEHGYLFDGVDYVWGILPKIGPYILGKLKPNCKALRARGDVLPSTVVLHNGNTIFDGFRLMGNGASKGNLQVILEGVELEGAAVVYAGASLLHDEIEIGAGTVVEPGAVIKGPTIIGKNSEVRQGAYLRGKCIVGDMCVVGHTTEMKNSVMLDGSKAGHFAYIGDSILGRDVNLGAGTKLANLKIVSSEVTLRVAGRSWSTGLRKFGAILGDGTETGCNSVTNPGAILGKGSLVYPCINVEGGYYPPRTVISAKKDAIRLRIRPVRKGK